MTKRDLIRIIAILLIAALGATGILVMATKELRDNRALPRLRGSELQDDAGEFVYSHIEWGTPVTDTFSELGFTLSQAFDETPADASAGVKVYRFAKPKAELRMDIREKEITVISGEEKGVNVRRDYGDKGSGILEFTENGLHRVTYRNDYIPRVPHTTFDTINPNAEYTLNEIEIVYEGYIKVLTENYGEPESVETTQAGGSTNHTARWVSAGGGTAVTVQAAYDQEYGTVDLILEKIN